MSDKIHILMIDDDEEDFIITRDILDEIRDKKYFIDWASNYSDGLNAVLQKKHDVYLVDYRLGRDTGLELIKEAIAQGCEEPLILLTGQRQVEIDSQAMAAGAVDYLVKGTISSDILDRTIRYNIEQAKTLKEIRKLNTELEKRVEERTLILSEAISELERTKEELNEALIKEKELNDLKSRFVSMVSHEFRTPLATILSSLTLVRKYVENNDTEKQVKHMDRIKTSINNLTDILNDVLSLSKLEDGKVYVNTTNLNLKEFITDVIADVQGLIKPGQQLIYNHSGTIEDVNVDRKILSHILANLISNAIKFSSEGKVVEISTRVSKDSFLIEVADHGIGISENDQKHLFESFFRGENAVNIQGTGLGLNIVSRYVDLLNGTIELESVLEEGTTFKVQIPQ